MFYKKSRAKVGGKYKWFPRACVNKHTVNTQDLGEAISRRCTVTPADVHAVIRSLPEVMSFFMENGNIPERRKRCGKYCRALGEGVELVKLGD